MRLWTSSAEYLTRSTCVVLWQLRLLFLSFSPPRFAVGDEKLVALLDHLSAAPHAHAELARASPSLLEKGVRLRLYAPVVVDEASLVPSGLRVDAHATMLGRPVEREIVVGAGPVVAVDLADVIEDECARRYFLCREEAELAASGVGGLRDGLNCDKRLLGEGVCRGGGRGTGCEDVAELRGDGGVVSGLREVLERVWPAGGPAGRGLGGHGGRRGATPCGLEADALARTGGRARLAGCRQWGSRAGR